MAEWQDISTAPKDGMCIDVWDGQERVPGASWRNGTWRHWWIDGFEGMGWVRLDSDPTHWMHIPEPPAA